MNHPPIWPGISWRNAGSRNIKRWRTGTRERGKRVEGGGLRPWETERNRETEIEKELKRDRWIKRNRDKTKKKERKKEV